MFKDSPASAPGFGATLATLIRAFRQVAPASTIRDTLKLLIPGFIGDAYLPASPQNVSLYVGSFQGLTVVLADGCTDLQQGVDVIAGYAGGPLSPVKNPRNEYLGTYVSIIKQLLLASGGGVTPEVICAGHSLGGAVVMEYAIALLETGSTARFKVVTFGSPRTAGIQGVAWLSRVNVCRWMNDDDPIPLLPPRFADLPAEVILFGVKPTQRLSEFVHSSGGISVSSVPSLTASDLPLAAPGNLPAALGAWLFNEDSAQATAHAIGAYIRRLDAWDTIHPAEEFQHQAVSRREPAGTATRQQMTSAEREFREALNLVGGQQKQAPFVQPAGFNFQAVRLSGSWYVSFLGGIVAAAPNKRGARGLAALGNAFMSRLHRQAFVDLDQLRASFGMYLEAASRPGKGFSPTIVTSLPGQS